MSIQQPRRTDHLENLGAVSGAMSVFDDGFELHPIIRRAALSTPSQWVDAFVAAVGDDGTIDLVTLDGSSEARWHNAGFGRLAVGSPVAFHAVYGVLAVGRELVSVRTV